jgi:LAGLIDADG-like domain
VLCATEHGAHCTAPIGSVSPIPRGSISSQRCSSCSDRRAGRTERVPHGTSGVLETTAPFLDINFDGRPLVGTLEGLAYVRGFFDAEGGMPCSQQSRLYLQFTQKSRGSLEVLVEILESWNIHCGRIHNPSAGVDPEYWRFYVRARSHERYMTFVNSWHPRKRRQIATRMVI